MQHLFTDQRVAVLVDVQNMFYSAKHQYNSKLDFAKLLKGCVANRRCIRAVSYIVQTEGIDQGNFIKFLGEEGFEIRSKQLKTRPDGTSKGDWDLGMAVDAIIIAEKVDVVVLVTGDGDFVDVVNLLKSRGVRTEIWSFPTNTSVELIECASEFFPIDQDMLIPYEY